MLSEPVPTLNIGSEYRDARRRTSLFCVIGLGWSSTQFDLKSLALGSVGVIDLTITSIPLVLTCGIVYMTVKSILGYAMQSKEVRRWSRAQIDFKILFFLVRITLLMLAAGGIHHSVETFAFVIAGVLAIVFGSLLLYSLGMLSLVPLIVAIRRYIGRPYLGASPVPYVAEASAWSELTVVILVVVILAALGFALLDYEPLLALWTEPPGPIAVTTFVVTAIGVVVSYWLQGIGERKLFARPVPKFTKRSDGTTGVSFPERFDANDE